MLEEELVMRGLETSAAVDITPIRVKNSIDNLEEEFEDVKSPSKNEESETTRAPVL